MNKALIKILVYVAILEFVFLTIIKVLLYTINHYEHEFIYYFNINVYYLITSLIWINFKFSKVNRVLISIFGIWFSISLPYSILFLFSGPNFSSTFNYLNYHILHIFTVSYQLLITLYIFVVSIFPNKSNRQQIFWSLFITIIFVTLNYAPMILNGEYKYGYEPLFSSSYRIHILNFSLLLIFWHQYTKNKIIFSEYLSNILSIFSILIALEIYEVFSIQNDLIFHYLSQYFTSVLYLIMMILWIIRLYYLFIPKSKENENYIKNYYILHGFVEKPHKGFFVEFYSSLNKKIVITIFSIMIFIGIYFFLFGKFKIFIRLNVLILIMATIISTVLAIITIYNRWYDSIGIFFKKVKR